MLEQILSIWQIFDSPLPTNIQNGALLVLRAGLGTLFILHGYPKLIHLKKWSDSLKMPISLCFLSASSMFVGGFCPIAGFLTSLACLVLFCSMMFALVLEIKQGLPLVAKDPYLIPKEDYEGSDGKGEPPSQEKAFVFNLILIALFVFGAGEFSVDAWFLN